MIYIESPERLVKIIHALTVSSFEAKYGQFTTDEVVDIFAFATQGYSQEQLNTGLAIMRKKGFCPYAAMFSRWCLGEEDFDGSDAIADGYIGKHAALANIIKWQQNSQKTQISTAEKQAYDSTYHLWNDITTTSDKIRAENAFRDFYEQIVAERVKDRISCEPYKPKNAIEQSEIKHTQADIEAGNKAADEFFSRWQAILKNNSTIPTNPLVE